jgi:hypothetical protein
MEALHHFLLVGADTEVLTSCSTSIKDRFPDASFSTSKDSEQAVAQAKVFAFDAVVVMGARDQAGPDLAATLLKASPGLPVLLVADPGNAHVAADMRAPTQMSSEYWKDITFALQILAASQQRAD